MRYELSDKEWSIIRTMIPTRPRVDDRRVLNGLFWVLRSGAPLDQDTRQRTRRVGQHPTAVRHQSGSGCAFMSSRPSLTASNVSSI
jgi:transposase